MRVAVAIALVVFALLGAVAPHEHGGAFGTHACAACVAAGGEEAGPLTLDVAPQVHLAQMVAAPAGLAPAPGAPLGAVPGQSPPCAV